MPNRRSAKLLPLTDEAAARIFLKLSPDAPEAEFNEACARALKLDPYAVEILFVLGQRADTLEQRLEYFHRASQAVAHKPRMMVAGIMPSLRLTMAETLVHDGRLSDAVEILRPALNEDPVDHEDVHCVLIDLMLRLGWDDELQPMVEAFREESAVAAFAQAVLEYRRHGGTPKANELLKQADSDFPGIAAILCGLQMPESSDDDDEELLESYIAQFLLPGVRDTAGAIKWIRETLSDSLRSQMEQNDRPSSEHALLAAAKRQTKTRANWDLAVKHFTDGAQSKWLVTILRKDQLLQLEHYDHEPGESELKHLLLSAVTMPQSGQPHRPAKLRVAASEHQQALSELCSKLSIKLEVASLSKKLATLLEHTAQQLRSSAERRDQAAPASGQIDALPCSGDVWLLGIFLPPIFIHDGPTPSRGWLTQIVNAKDGRVLYANVEENQPSPEQLWNSLCQLMLHPEEGPAARPERVLVDAECWSDRFSTFQEVAIERGDARVSEFFTRLVGGMLEFQGPIQPALRNQAGVDDDMLANLYSTAARFYRVSPWKMIGPDRFFEVSCDAWQNPRWAACIIGQMGQERGLTIYDKPDDALAFWNSSGKKLSKLNSAAVQFSEAHECIPVDVWNIERCGWDVAAFEGFPFVARISNGKSLVAATAEDVKTLTAIMQHAVQFIEQPPAEKFEVNHEGTKLRMRWLN